MAASTQIVLGGLSMESTRALSSAKASSSSKQMLSSCSVPEFSTRHAVKQRNFALVRPSSASSLHGLKLSVTNGRSVCEASKPVQPRGVVVVRASDEVGQNPDWLDDDYIVLGLAHCFSKNEDGKLFDTFVIEPIPAGGLECMENGGRTCYLHATGTTLEVALKQDLSLLAKEFSSAKFCNDFAFRTKCASRTWKRDHAVKHLMNLVPRDGTVRSDWNFSLEEKRILNQEHVVNDSDNIKQDMSIDVYGRTEKEEAMKTEIGELYNV